MLTHTPRYAGWRPGRVTVACWCGWISERHTSRGQARRAYDWHAGERMTNPVDRIILEPETIRQLSSRLNRDDQLPELVLMLMRGLYVEMQAELRLPNVDAPDLRVPGGFVED